METNDREVTIEEANEICQGRPIFNGCTHAYLKERYGNRVYHRMGVGWFVRPERAGGGEAAEVPPLTSIEEQRKGLRNWEAHR